MDLISVVVPVYNVKKYLKRCIDSIEKQTYKNIEVILVDDGSNDGSEIMCDEFEKKYENIKVVHKENGGLSSARNEGIKIATGQYIGFVDSDDFIDEKMYECLYNNLIETESDISVCKPYKYSQEDEICESKEEEKIITYEGIEILRNMYRDYFTIVVSWNKLYKKELFDEVKYPEGKIIEDAAVIHYLLNKSSKIVISNLELYFYYQREDSIMHNSNLRMLDELDGLYDRAKFFEECGYIDEEFYNETIKMYLEKFWELYKVLNKYNFYKPKVYKKYFKYLKEVLNKVKQLTRKEKIKYKLFYRLKYLFWILVYTYKATKRIIAKLESISDNFIFRIRYKKYIRTIKKRKQCQFLIFNGPNHGNLGDHAILLAEETLLRNKGVLPFEILSHQAKYFIKKYKDVIKSEDVIMITGGGNLGTLWEHEQIGVNKVINELKENKIVIFPQTIYYSKDRHGNYRMKVDNELYHKCKELLVSCRDKKTYDFCKEVLNVNSIYTPDIVTFLDYSNNSNQRSGIMMCFRDDKERVIDDKMTEEIKKALLNRFHKESIKCVSTVISGRFSYNKGKREVLNLLDEISKSKLFITDRLHGMIFACITGTPCIALANSSGKVKGVYEWIKQENEYVKFVENMSEIENALNEIDFNVKYKYKNEKMKKALNQII